MTLEHDVVVIGGGQAALSVGWYLRRTPRSFVILDDGVAPGGAWRQTWPSLRLFSPARYSSLPGMMMDSSGTARDYHYPTREETIAYLASYEERYQLPIRRPVHIRRVERAGDRLVALDDDGGAWSGSHVVSATGTWSRPWMPHLPGLETFGGEILHSAWYRSADRFAGKRLLVVGGGNSGAQIVADLAPLADVVWATREEPRFLPEEVDGRYLFLAANARFRAMQEEGKEIAPPDLGDIVQVESIRLARRDGLLDPRPMPRRFVPDGAIWDDGTKRELDAVILATGFRPALEHLRPLGVIDRGGRIEVDGTRSVAEPRLWLVGYGGWTGFASATMIGVGRTAKETVERIVASEA